MPLYEYRCCTCGSNFEMLRRIQDADQELKCPDCRSEEVERQVSTFAMRGCGQSSSGGFT